MMKRIRSIVIWLIILLISVLVSLWWDLGSLNDAFNQTILLKVRLPRVLEAMLTGATLTIAGHMFQTILNNPLADSFTLGLASGASLGSGLALFLGLSFLWVPFFSIAFSLITLVLVLGLTVILSRGYPIRVLIILGLMIGALFNALLYMLVLINPRKMNSIANYLFGGFASAEYHDVIIIALTMIVAMVILFSMKNGIKLLQVGELKSQSLGLNVQNVMFIVLAVIGFIGMIVPQLLRRFYWQYELGTQMVLNLIVGSTVMVVADFIGGTMIQPVQIPASIIMALLGVPVLFYILFTQTKVLR